MNKENNNEIFIGALDENGSPRGRGTIIFGDGRKYSGSLDNSKSDGRGVYSYPDGSRLECGFTINQNHPAWRFIYPDGRILAGFISYPPADDEKIERGVFNETDKICAVITQTAKECGLSVEYNARTLLADALLRRYDTAHEIESGIKDALTISRVCGGILTSPDVLRYIYGG